MSQRTIIFSSPEDVLNFVRTVEKYPYDMDLESDEVFIPECEEDTGKSVAIIGGGPMGLSAAYFLRQIGLMNLGLNKEIELKVYDENCQDLFDEISEYFAA